MAKQFLWVVFLGFLLSALGFSAPSALTAPLEFYGSSKSFQEKIPLVKEDYCRALLADEILVNAKKAITSGLGALFGLSATQTEKVTYAEWGSECLARYLQDWNLYHEDKRKTEVGVYFLEHPEKDEDSYFRQYKKRRVLTRFMFQLRKDPKTKAEGFCAEMAAQELRDKALIDRNIQVRQYQKLEFPNFNVPKRWVVAEKYGLSEVEMATLYQYTWNYFEPINQLNAALAKSNALPKDLDERAQNLYPHFQDYRKVLDGALEKLPKFSGPVVRWTKSTYVPHRVGCPVKYAIYPSTSKDLNFHFGEDSLERFLIFAKGDRGHLITPVSDHEKESEVLFARDSSFMVLGKREFMDKDGLGKPLKRTEWILAEGASAAEVDKSKVPKEFQGALEGVNKCD